MVLVSAILCALKRVQIDFFSWDLGQNRQSEVEIVTPNLHFSCISQVIFTVLKLSKYICILYNFF